MAGELKVMTGINGLPFIKSIKRIEPSKLHNITHFKQKLKLTIGDPRTQNKNQLKFFIYLAFNRLKTYPQMSPKVCLRLSV